MNNLEKVRAWIEEQWDTLYLSKNIISRGDVYESILAFIDSLTEEKEAEERLNEIKKTLQPEITDLKDFAQLNPKRPTPSTPEQYYYVKKDENGNFKYVGKVDTVPVLGKADLEKDREESYNQGVIDAKALLDTLIQSPYRL